MASRAAQRVFSGQSAEAPLCPTKRIARVLKKMNYTSRELFPRSFPMKLGGHSSAQGVAAPLLAALLAANVHTAMPAIAHTTTSSFTSAVAAQEELRPEQIKFLEERAKLKQQYESQVEGTFKTESETQDKKITYQTVVGGLIAIAFIAPMVQFFYYTGGE